MIVETDPADIARRIQMIGAIDADASLLHAAKWIAARIGDTAGKA